MEATKPTPKIGSPVPRRPGYAYARCQACKRTLIVAERFAGLFYTYCRNHKPKLGRARKDGVLACISLPPRRKALAS